MLEARLRLDEGLSTRAAGCDGFCKQFARGVASGNGQRSDGLVGMACAGGEQCGTLGTDGDGEGCILLVAAAHDNAVLQPHGSPHRETGVGRIRAVGLRNGLLHQFSVFG